MVQYAVLRDKGQYLCLNISYMSYLLLLKECVNLFFLWFPVQMTKTNVFWFAEPILFLKPTSSQVVPVVGSTHLPIFFSNQKRTYSRAAEHAGREIIRYVVNLHHFLLGRNLNIYISLFDKHCVNCMYRAIHQITTEKKVILKNLGKGEVLLIDQWPKVM